MNDPLDSLEQRLRRQPVKPVPADWRAEILAAARAAQPSPHAARSTYHAWLSALHQHLAAFLSPTPKAWAGLAAVWVVIFLLHFSMSEPQPVLAAQSPAPTRSAEVVAELRQQHQFYAELIGPTDSRESDRPRLAPRPHSQRAELSAV